MGNWVRYFSWLAPAPLPPEIQDSELVDKKYAYWRIRVFYSLFIGYAFYYFTRKSFTFAMPSLMTDLGFSKADLGLLASILYCTYGVSKFASGILSDSLSPRYFFSLGLIITGVANLFFGYSSTVFWFAIFWGLNGWFQGCGWPPVAKYLTHWYSRSERGRWWAVWNTSHNVGGALIPIIAAACTQYWGWRYAMYVPGVLCILCGFFMINRLRDTPESLGLPSIERHRNDYNDDKKPESVSGKEALFNYVLKNPYLWVLGFAYFFVYIVRTAINDWSVLYLVEWKHYSEFQAGKCVAAFEIGGLLGSLAAGWASDRLFGGMRGQVNVLFTLGTVGALFLFWATPAGHPWLDLGAVFLVGFTVFGPQMVIGIAAAELSHKKAAGAATGFVGCFAYLGAAVTGYPLGRITEQMGWNGFFTTVLACGALALCLLIPLWSSGKIKKELETEKEARA